MSIYVATETGTLTVGDEVFVIYAGRTRVREGHPLLKQHPSFFEPSDAHVDYEWEVATKAPGEKRGPGRPRKTEE